MEVHISGFVLKSRQIAHYNNQTTEKKSTNLNTAILYLLEYCCFINQNSTIENKKCSSYENKKNWVFCDTVNRTLTHKGTLSHFYFHNHSYPLLTAVWNTAVNITLSALLECHIQPGYALTTDHKCSWWENNF